MSIDSARERFVTANGELGVPWLTVLPLAAVMAYADGFWMLSLRGAVGAIERTQEPFVSWARESTLALPLFVLAVLAAVTLALRWFGPVLRTPRAVAATGLLVVAAGTVVGVAEIVGSSLYDYYLEFDQMAAMNSMHGLCVGSCLAQAQQSTIAAMLRAVLYACGFILVTNLVLIGWVVAFRGGQLNVTSTRHRLAAVDTRDGHGTRLWDIRVLLVAGLLGSAAIHAAVIPEHLDEWTAAGAFFVLLAAAEIAVAGLVIGARHRLTLAAAAAISAGPLLLWLYSRTAGLPFGPAAGRPEEVGLPDIVCCALEVVTLLAAVALMRGERSSRRQRPAASSHIRWLAVVAIISATAIGLAGTTPAWFDGSDNQPEMTMAP